MISCKSCNIELPDGTAYCTKCGREAWEDGRKVSKKLDYPCPFCKGRLFHSWSQLRQEIVIGIPPKPKTAWFDQYVCENCGFKSEFASDKTSINQLIGKKK